MNRIINKPYDKVTSLTLVNAELTEFPEEIFLCKNIRKLNLSKNKIKSIPTKIKELAKLKVLNLSNNEISQIQVGCCKLSKLKTLILNNNKITSIPKQIDLLQNLEILGLSGNRITKLPNDLQKLIKLKQLDISRNELTHLIDGMCFCNLDTLWCGSNPVSDFGKESYFKGGFKRLYFYPCHPLASNDDYIELSFCKGNAICKDVKIISKEHSQMNSSKSIFICYSHKDEDYKDRVLTHLKVLNFEQRGCKISIWNDSKIQTGSDWKQNIINAISNASGAILIASTDFLASDFIQMEELPRILENVSKDKIRIFPIVVKPCRYNNSVLQKYQSVNIINKPLSGMKDTEREEIYLKLADDIDKLI